MTAKKLRSTDAPNVPKRQMQSMKTKILTLLVMVISLGMTHVSLLAAEGTEPPSAGSHRSPRDSRTI